MACCVECERRELHALLVRRGVVKDRVPGLDAAWEALVRSYELDAADETDRAWGVVQDRQP